MRIPFLVVCLGALLGPLDGSVNVAFPAITRAFDLALGDIQWIVVSYILAQSSLTLAFGRLGDLHGHRRIFLAGMWLSAAVFMANGLAATYPMLVATRALQGIAIGLSLASGPALVTLMYPESRKRAILAIYVSLTSIGGAVGPLIAGVLVDHAGWPGVFWFRAPLALLVVAFAHTIPHVNRPSPAAHGPAGFDVPGLVLMAAALACLVLALSLLRGPYGSPALSCMLFAVAVLAGFGFVRHESRCPAPMLRMRPFRDPPFLAMQLAAAAIHLATFAIFLLMPYVLVLRDDHSTLRTGVLLSVFAAGSIVGGFSDRIIAGRIAARAVLLTGVLLSSGGLLLLAMCADGHSLSAIGAAHVLTGIGLGLFSVGHMEATTTALPPEERGVAGSLVAVMRMVGLVLGATILTALHDALGGAGAGVRAFQGTFAAAAAVLVVAALALHASAHWRARGG